MLQDLSAALGKFSVVFCCTAALDLTRLGNVMKGLATTGAWVVVDNLDTVANRVVLSTLAMQALALRTALVQGKTEVLLDGTLISPIERSFFMHVTITPGLDAPHHLPEDLKVLFRTTVMAVPDADFMCRALIQAEGFHNVDTLKRKLVCFFDLAGRLLPKSDPRRFGLHGMKVCVRMMAAGAWQLQTEAGVEAMDRASMTEDGELNLLLRVLRTYSEPMVIRDDASILDGILLDLFPGLTMQPWALADAESVSFTHVVKTAMEVSTPSLARERGDLRERIEGGGGSTHWAGTLACPCCVRHRYCVYST